MTLPDIPHLFAYALAGGGIGAFVLLPWSRSIPLDLHRAWAFDHQNYQPFLTETAQLDLSKATRIAIIIGAALMCLGMALALGASLDTAALCMLLLGWLLLTVINLRHELLPDRIMLALLWLGLLYRASTGPASDYVLGAASGYLAPWLVTAIVRSKTGRDIVGYGDLKAFAVAGAWFGWAALPTLYATFLITVLLMMGVFALRGAHHRKTMPTAPAHMATAVVAALGFRLF